MSKELERKQTVMIDPRAFNIQPVVIPQRTFHTSLISGMYRNMKMKQIEKEVAFQAQIAEHQRKTAEHGCAMIQAISTLGDRIEAEKAEAQSRKAMAEAASTKASLENKILYHQAEQEEIAAKIAKMNFDELRNGNGASED
ncbi:MAG: hypothetical protein AB9873_13030 [Syntrophobacteraceae bacterium]